MNKPFAFFSFVQNYVQIKRLNVVNKIRQLFYQRNLIQIFVPLFSNEQDSTSTTTDDPARSGTVSELVTIVDLLTDNMGAFI